MSSTSRFTVFTPTFNRRSELARCYRSLTDQTVKRFEWLIVDDGSTDDTADLVRSWIEEAPFPIRLTSQENGGKWSAIGHALSLNLCEYTIFLDSDDELGSKCIEELEALARDNRGRDFVGFIGNQVDRRTGVLVGTPIPDDVVMTSGRELAERYDVRGDTLRVYRSDLLKSLKLPSLPGERLVPENVLFDPIDRMGERLLAVHAPLYISGYQEDGYSANIAMHRALSPRGFAAAVESRAYTSGSIRIRIKSTLIYQTWCAALFGLGRWPLEFRRRLTFWLCLPWAAGLYMVRRPAFVFEARRIRRGLGTPQSS